MCVWYISLHFQVCNHRQSAHVDKNHLKQKSLVFEFVSFILSVLLSTLHPSEACNIFQWNVLKMHRFANFAGSVKQVFTAVSIRSFGFTTLSRLRAMKRLQLGIAPTRDRRTPNSDNVKGLMNKMKNRVKNVKFDEKRRLQRKSPCNSSDISEKIH